MKRITQEWVDRAEDDFVIVEREFRARKRPSYGGMCFHAQQCVEKYIKARMSEAGHPKPIPRTHDLVALLDVVLRIEPTWESFRESLAYLSQYAVAFRYPGETADRSRALDARRRCRSFRNAARRGLGITE